MIPTAAQILGDLHSDIVAFQAATDRSQQVETGASQLYGCVAETIYRLRGAPREERLSWPAVVGTSIHEYLATARPKVRDDVITEQRFVYKNVPATVDYLQSPLLVDYKTRDDDDAIDDMVSDGISPKWLGQLMVGAAGAREAGHTVEWVAIVLLPRSGEFTDAKVLGPYPFDQQLADDAAEWSLAADDLAADESVDPRDHRGRPAFWCVAYCPFVKPCRGEVVEVQLDELASVAERYREAQDVRDDAVAEMQRLRPLIPVGVKGKAGRTSLSHSTGSVKTVEEEDVDRLRETWRFVHGDGEPLPTRVVEKASSPRLTVKWAKP